MIEYKTGDLLAVKSGIIVHGVNVLGAMGAGVALSIRNKYPECYADYRRYLASYDNKEEALGDVHYYRVNKDLLIANAFTQDRIGWDEDGTPPASINAVKLCFIDVANIATTIGAEVHFPKIGCGLGGLLWKDVSDVIEYELRNIKATCWTL